MAHNKTRLALPSLTSLPWPETFIESAFFMVRENAEKYAAQGSIFINYAFVTRRLLVEFLKSYPNIVNWIVNYSKIFRLKQPPREGGEFFIRFDAENQALHAVFENSLSADIQNVKWPFFPVMPNGSTRLRARKT